MLLRSTKDWTFTSTQSAYQHIGTPIAKLAHRPPRNIKLCGTRAHENIDLGPDSTRSNKMVAIVESGIYGFVVAWCFQQESCTLFK